FKQLRVTGMDRSGQQLGHARRLAFWLENCSFEKGDARNLPALDASFDAVVASRLFVILPERDQALTEMHRVLKPGGRLFVAEPRSALRAAVPLRAMRLLAGVEALFGGNLSEYREPGRVYVMGTGEFGELVGTQPWSSVRLWQDFWYQYAVCEKQGVGSGE
ncbi:MAG: class I SAM-dependent methyltransferase, partial [Rubrobacter sp.]